MARINAFLLGVWEFRSDVTSSVAEIDAYDWGREWAHRLTFRMWDY